MQGVTRGQIEGMPFQARLVKQFRELGLFPGALV